MVSPTRPVRGWVEVVDYLKPKSSMKQEDLIPCHLDWYSRDAVVLSSDQSGQRSQEKNGVYFCIQASGGSV